MRKILQDVRFRYFALFCLIVAFSPFNNCSPKKVTHSTAAATASTLTLSPPSANVVPGGTVQFTASGGSPPYQFSLGPGSPGSLSQGSATTVTYNAPTSGSAGQVLVKDSSGNSAVANILIGNTGSGGLVLTPSTVAVAAGAQVTFSVSGGTPPYYLSATAGSFNQTVYTAPTSGGTVTVTATDSSSPVKTAQASVTVTGGTATKVTFDVFTGPACYGYCSCHVAGQPGVPSDAAAYKICVALGYNTIHQYTTTQGPVGYLQCDPYVQGCFTNQNPDNIVCTTVTCSNE
ncbi:MAG: hypothetical protein AB7F86_16550 [Bdellovibrionales bacterium]